MAASVAAVVILAIFVVVLSQVFNSDSTETRMDKADEEQKAEETEDWSKPAIIAGTVLVVVVVSVVVLLFRCTKCKTGETKPLEAQKPSDPETLKVITEAPPTLKTAPIEAQKPTNLEAPKVFTESPELAKNPKTPSVLEKKENPQPPSVPEDLEWKDLFEELAKRDPSSLMTDREKIFLKWAEIYSAITKDLSPDMISSKRLPGFMSFNNPFYRVKPDENISKLKVYHALVIAIFLKGPFKSVKEVSVPEFLCGAKVLPSTAPICNSSALPINIAFKSTDVMARLKDIDSSL